MDDLTNILGGDPLPAPDTIPDLTDVQEQAIIDAWNHGATSLKECVAAAFGDGVDGRDKRATLVKKFLAGRNLKAVPAQNAKKLVGPFVLSEAQKEFIASNAGAYDNWLELAKELFQNKQLTYLFSEAKAVKEYYDSLDPSLKAKTSDEIEAVEYNPPKTEVQAISRINRYCFDGIDASKITPRQKECVKKLIKYMNSYRFTSEMSCLIKADERKAMESCFVRMTFDKPDLTSEDVELYINYGCDLVAAARMKREEEGLLIEIENIRSTAQGAVPKTLTDQLSSLREDKDRCLSRQKKTLDDLNTKRTARLKEGGTQNITVLSLIEAFREKMKKDQIIKIGRARAKEVKDEVKRLETMEDLKVEIFGLDPEEIFM